MDTSGDGESEAGGTGVGSGFGSAGEGRTEGGEDTEPTEHTERDTGGFRGSHKSSPNEVGSTGDGRSGFEGDMEGEGKMEKDGEEEGEKEMEGRETTGKGRNGEKEEEEEVGDEGREEEEKLYEEEKPIKGEENGRNIEERHDEDLGEKERENGGEEKEGKVGEGERVEAHKGESNKVNAKDDDNEDTDKVEGNEVSDKSTMVEDENKEKHYTEDSVSYSQQDDTSSTTPQSQENQVNSGTLTLVKDQEEKEEGKENGVLTWSVITPAQSPMQPILEAFPSPQVPILSTVQSPQTPLLGHTVEEVTSHPSEVTFPGEDAQEGAVTSRLLRPITDGPSSTKPFTHSAESLEQPLLEGVDAQEHQPLLESFDRINTLSSSAQSRHLAATLPHRFQSPKQHQPHKQNQQQHKEKQQEKHHTQHQRSRKPPSALSLAPLPLSSSISDQPLAATSLSPLQPPLVSHRSSGAGHSSGLVPLQLSSSRHQSILIAASPGQPVLTTLQSPQQPHRVRQAPQQPVLAPLQLPNVPRRHSPLDLSSSLTPPLPPPGSLDPFLVGPRPCEAQEENSQEEEGRSGVTLGAEGGHDLPSDAAYTGGPSEGASSSSGHQEGEGATANHAKPNRNLHLDLGWVWGQDATRCRAARTPERSRARKARAVPVSPAVAPLAADMDTTDSGLGTAEGDLSFAAPYPPCLPTSADLAATTQTTFMLSDKWKSLFDKYDPEGQGEVSVDAFRALLADSRFRSQVAPHKLEVLETLAGNGRSSVTYQDLVNIMSNKRRRSFKIAVHCRDQDIVSENDFRLETARPGVFSRMVRRIAKEFLTDERDRQYYADHYTCCPPPVFVPAVTLIEVGFFIYYSVEAGDISPSGPVPANSMFIYRPDKRVEIWRFFFYMLIHAGWVHLFFNMLVQLLVGVPLEMVHGSFRIGTVYMAGVLAGSLGTSVFDMDAYLVGASGGVYALLAAHLANILLNYSEMELGIFKLVAVFIIASADVGFAIWDRYSSDTSSPPVGYVSHLMGALAGLTIGLLVLKNFQQKLHVQILWWVALGVYCVCTMFAIFWNILYY